MRFTIDASFNAKSSLIGKEKEEKGNPHYNSYDHFNFTIDDDEITDERFIICFHNFMKTWCSQGIETFFKRNDLKLGENVFILPLQQKGDHNDIL